MFVYSDGLNEAENLQQEQFGDDRLLAMIKRSSELTPRQVVKALKSEVERHRDGAEPNDDFTLLCLRVK